MAQSRQFESSPKCQLWCGRQCPSCETFERSDRTLLSQDRRFKLPVDHCRLGLLRRALVVVGPVALCVAEPKVAGQAAER